MVGIGAVGVPQERVEDEAVERGDQLPGLGAGQPGVDESVDVALPMPDHRPSQVLVACRQEHELIPRPGTDAVTAQPAGDHLLGRLALGGPIPGEHMLDESREETALTAEVVPDASMWHPRGVFDRACRRLPAPDGADEADAGIE